jgi:hypothetical protein
VIKNYSNEASKLKRGRPKSSKLDPPIDRAMVAHVRARGLELYHYKASKFDDHDLLVTSKLVKALVRKVSLKKL